MNYLTFPVGIAGPGAVVEVTLSGVESDVFLVDSVNLTRLKSGQRFNYTGGHYRQSPVRLGVPARANWTVVVIPNGGTVHASARLVA